MVSAAVARNVCCFVKSPVMNLELTRRLHAPPQFYKIDSPTFNVWLRVLKDSPGAVLWLRSESEDAHAALKASANKSGVDPQR